MTAFFFVMIVILAVSVTIGVIATGVKATHWVMGTTPVKQLPQLSEQSVNPAPGEYIRRLDNTLLWVEDGGEKDPHIIDAMEEVEEICSTP